jgi:peptide/nickel transport system substrate-binding protein
VVPPADLTTLDPIVPGYITRDHGYLVYDTLFGMDAEGKVAPQMVDTYEVSEDRLSWTFTLRDGLEFHDGTPVTSGDVIASIQRWAQRDTMGQRLLSYSPRWETVDARTFRMTLNAPYSHVVETLGKPNFPAFIMPRRIAETAPTGQIDDPTGSGPFIFKKDEWKPGEQVVYVRNVRYKPRIELPSGTAGGKIARVDRIEWRIIRDAQTQANALAAGEVDLIAVPAYERRDFFAFPEEFLDDHLENVPDVLQSFLSGVTPGGSSGGFKSGTVRMKRFTPIFMLVVFDDNFENVAFQAVLLARQSYHWLRRSPLMTLDNAG